MAISKTASKSYIRHSCRFIDVIKAICPIYNIICRDRFEKSYNGVRRRNPFARMCATKRKLALKDLLKPARSDMNEETECS